MCIWDRLARCRLQHEMAREPQQLRAARIEVTPPTKPLVPTREIPHMQAYAIRASLGIEYYVSREMEQDSAAMAEAERLAREDLARLLYEDVLVRLDRIDAEIAKAADMDYRAADTVRPMIRELRDYMTRDDGRACGEEAA